MQIKPIKGIGGAKGAKSALANTMEATVKEGSLTELYIMKQAAARGTFGAALDILSKAKDVGAKSKAQLGNKLSKIYSPALSKAWKGLTPGRQVGLVGVPAVAGTAALTND